jgi:uncharacterized protein (TIGR02118 family)
MSMIVVSVTYPNADNAKFDFDYFLNKHMPLIRGLLSDSGLEDLRALRGLSAPGGGPAAHRAVSLLSFASLEGFQSGIAKHGAAIFADRPNFTDIQPLFQVNEPIG